jgi:hypothetical protein
MPSVLEEPEPIVPTGTGRRWELPGAHDVGVSLSSVNTIRRVVPLGSNLTDAGLDP